ncbi:MAG: hypothetical protein Fur002_15080 [Anaerolineales bacterium]
MLAMLLSACAAPAPQMVSAYASSSAQAWLTQLYACAANESVALRLDAERPDIRLQLGEAENATLPAYQVGEEEIVVAANQASPLKNLSPEEARRLFGQAESNWQVWILPAGEGAQRAFQNFNFYGAALVADSAQQMALNLSNDPNAAGILPAHWLNDSLRVLYSAGSLPVLALTQPAPAPIVLRLIACLQ